MKPAEPAYTRSEEIANCLTHGVGLLFSLAAAVLIIAVAAWKGTACHVVSVSVYSATLVLLFAASTLYHSIPSARAKRALKVLDHTAIFLLIAGSYTPYLLVTLRGPWGWSLFGLVWGLALVGITLKFYWTGRFRLLSTLLYLAMGWLALLAIRPLYRALPPGGFTWLAAGGLLYTAGSGFYLARLLPYNHAIWHLFVLVAGACHFISVFFYVLPR